MPVILVADDEAIIRHLIVQALTDAGYEVLSAANGGEALAQARRHRPDLILLDYHMPMIEGDIVLKRLRNDPFLRQTPVIMLTSADQKSDIMVLAPYKLDGYILKSSFDLNTLIKRVDEALNRQAQDEAEANNEADENNTDRRSLTQRPSEEFIRRSQDPMKRLKQIKPMVTKSKLHSRLGDYDQLPALSSAILYVKAMSQKTGTSVSELAEAAQLDIGVSALFLNALHDSSSAAPENLKSAVLKVGMGQIATVADSALLQYYFEDYEAQAAAQLRSHWSHSVLCGQLAGEILRASGASPELARFGRLAASFRYAYRLLLIDAYPQQYALTIDAAKSCRTPLAEAEPRLMGCQPGTAFQHAPALARLPKPIRDSLAIRLTHPDQLDDLKPDQSKCYAAIELADRLATAQLGEESLDQFIEPASAWAEALSIKPDRLSAVLTDARDQFANDKIRITLYGDAQDWPESESLLSKRLGQAARVLYVSHPAHGQTHRCFFEAMSRGAEKQPPKLAVVFIHDPVRRDQLVEQLVDRETTQGVGPLPLLILSPNGRHRLPPENLGDRAMGMAPASFHCEEMTDWMMDLLNRDQHQQQQRQHGAA